MKLDRFDLLAAAALLLTLALIAASPVRPKALGDNDFHDNAKRLALALTADGPFSAVHLGKAPGPVFYFAVPYLVVPAHAPDQSYWSAAVVWTSAWMVLALWLIRRTATALAGATAGRLAAGMALLSPFSAYYSLGINAEGPAYVSVALFLYGWSRSRADAPPRWATPLMTLGLLCLILCRPNAALVPVVALAAAWILRHRDAVAARRTTLVAVNALVLGLTMGGLASWHSRASGHADQEDYFWHVALQGRFQFRTEPLDWRFWDDSTRGDSQDYAAYAQRVTALKQQAQAEQATRRDVTRAFVVADTMAHPLVTMQMALVRVVALHVNLVNSRPPSAFTFGPLPGAVVYWGFHLMVNLVGLSISVLALIGLWRQRSTLAAVWPLWAPWLSLVAFHAIVYAEPRYLLPSRVCQIVLAASMATAAHRVRDGR